jgi:alpha-1,3-rhamnosyl/mannosyltransferase
MRVLVNRSLAQGQKTGIGHYTAQLLRSLKQQVGPGEKISGFPGGWLWRVGQSLSRPVLARGQNQAPSEAGKPLSWWQTLRQKTLGSLRGLRQAYLTHSLRKRLNKGGYDLYHEPNVIPLPCDVATVATVHDLSLLVHPQWHPKGRVAFFEQNLVSLFRCVHILADTEFTRQETIRALTISPEKISTVHLGIRADMTPQSPDMTRVPLRRLGLPDRYLLFVGTLEPRKNLLMLLQAYCALPEKLRRQCPLVLAGNWGWCSAPIADFFHAQAKNRGVIHLGYVSDELLPALYNGARALVYPSHYEGFGFPPLEMMACGGAVIVSTTGALVETAGKRAHLIDPLDLDGWRNAMARIIEDDEWWRSLRTGVVEHARTFTWEKCAAETLNVYRLACGREVARLQVA